MTKVVVQNGNVDAALKKFKIKVAKSGVPSKLKEKNEYFIEEELVDIAKSMRTFRLVRNFLKENLEQDSNLLLISENLYSNKKLNDDIPWDV